MRAIDLLTRNDKAALRKAMREGGELEMERLWQPTGFHLRVTVKKADPIWETDFIARVQTQLRGTISSQYIPDFESLTLRLMETEVGP